MHSRSPKTHGLLETHRRLAVDNLKRCPLCGTVNAKMNCECFVCRWHGEFDNEPDSVEDGLVEVLERCPELVDCILYVPRRPSLFDIAKDWVRSRKRRGLDFEA